MESVAEHRASNGGGDLVSLLGAVSNGDRDAFATLYARSSAKLYGICLRLLGSEAEAQDVLQEVYVTVWQKAERFDSTRASPITWLAVLARNKAIDRLRRRALASEDLEEALEIEDGGPTAFEIVEKAQDETRLGLCLDELEERARKMIRTAFLDGVTYPELAAREGVPVGTMKSWIRRGLQQLRRCLDR
ncbi:MAG TPA: sigma-70 family RNA polymerase sigma factor [Sphingomicrobium sp.]|nr:sigma-70 family RNA polymerase sigma factor [Sphingomicrobium sp.]